MIKCMYVNISLHFCIIVLKFKQCAHTEAHIICILLCICFFKALLLPIFVSRASVACLPYPFFLTSFLPTFDVCWPVKNSRSSRKATAHTRTNVIEWCTNIHTYVHSQTNECTCMYVYVCVCNVCQLKWSFNLLNKWECIQIKSKLSWFAWVLCACLCVCGYWVTPTHTHTKLTYMCVCECHWVSFTFALCSSASIA